MMFQAGESSLCIYMENNQLGVMWESDSWLFADTTPVSDGNWYYIAIVFDRGQLAFYKDGNQRNDSFLVLAKYALGYVNVGGASPTGISSFVGLMWNAKVWDGALTPETLPADMYQTFADATIPSDLLLLSSFDMAANTATNLHNNTTSTITNAGVAWVAFPLNAGFAF